MVEQISEEIQMKAEMLGMLVQLAMKKLSPEQLKEWADKGLDKIEDAVEATANPYDDMVVLPACKLIRTSFTIPDNDDE